MIRSAAANWKSASVVRSSRSCLLGLGLRHMGLRHTASSRMFSVGPEEPSTDSAQVLNESAKYLTLLRQQELGRPLTQEEADSEAFKWIDAISQLRKEYTQDGQQTYSPSKVFAPKDSANPSEAAESDNFNILRYISESVAVDGTLKFQPNEAQKQKLAHVKEHMIPERHDETINYLTNLIMRHGLKARAQKIMSQALYLVHLETREDPVQQLKETLDKMAPLLKLRRYTDGGARSEMVPAPLTERQRIRQAWLWIVESSNKRPSKDFSVRLAEEIISAIKGKSPGFEKKVQQHQLAIVNRSYISLITRKKRR